jgi:hypothetical protein
MYTSLIFLILSYVDSTDIWIPSYVDFTDIMDAVLCRLHWHLDTILFPALKINMASEIGTLPSSRRNVRMWECEPAGFGSREKWDHLPSDRNYPSLLGQPEKFWPSPFYVKKERIPFSNIIVISMLHSTISKISVYWNKISSGCLKVKSVKNVS